MLFPYSSLTVPSAVRHECLWRHKFLVCPSRIQPSDFFVPVDLKLGSKFFLLCRHEPSLSWESHKSLRFHKYIRISQISQVPQIYKCFNISDIVHWNIRNIRLHVTLSVSNNFLTYVHETHYESQTIGDVPTIVILIIWHLKYQHGNHVNSDLSNSYEILYGNWCLMTGWNVHSSIW